MIQTETPPKLSGDDCMVDIPSNIALPQMNPDDMVQSPEPQFSKQPTNNGHLDIPQKARVLVYVANNVFAPFALVVGSLLLLGSLVPSVEVKIQNLKEGAMFLLGAGSTAYKSRTKDNT